MNVPKSGMLCIPDLGLWSGSRKARIENFTMQQGTRDEIKTIMELACVQSSLIL
jgi:hypothetical protein